MDAFFIEQLTVYEPLADNEIAIVMDKAEKRLLEKEDLVLKEGEISRHVNFVATGLLMYYKITEAGDEKIYDFAMEGDWASQYQSMLTQTPSPLSIRALEKTVVYSISAENLQSLYSEIPVFERIAMSANTLT